MALETLTFDIVIHAPARKVWDVMLADETYRQWTEAFTAGSHYDGRWEVGARMRFLDPNGGGMIAEIAELRPTEFLSVRMLGWIIDGVEDTESEAVTAWAPGYETYTLQERDGSTTLRITSDALPEYKTIMEAAWPNALLRLKQICEETA